MKCEEAKSVVIKTIFSAVLCAVIFAIVILGVLLGTTGCTKPASTEYNVEKQTKCDNYTLLNDSAESGQFVLIGDSIVELFPEEIFADMPFRTYNRGISGDTSDKMLERLDNNALKISPSKIFILVGTNDLSRGVDLDVIKNNIAATVDKCKEKGVEKIIVSSLLPVNKAINSGMVGGRKNADIITLNGKISAMCTEKSVTFVDMFTPLKDGDGNFDANRTYDGLHPNAKGFLVMAQILKTLL